jgi:Mg2+ and Co2+ transporter CorA
MVQTRRNGGQLTNASFSQAIARGGNRALGQLVGVRKTKALQPKKQLNSRAAAPCAAQELRIRVLERIVQQLKTGRAKTTSRASNRANRRYQNDIEDMSNKITTIENRVKREHAAKQAHRNDMARRVLTMENRVRRELAAKNKKVTWRNEKTGKPLANARTTTLVNLDAQARQLNKLARVLAVQKNLVKSLPSNRAARPVGR